MLGPSGQLVPEVSIILHPAQTCYTRLPNGKARENAGYLGEFPGCVAMTEYSFEDQIYEQVTRGIRVSVVPHFLEDQSDLEEERFVWAYTIRIDNDSAENVRLCRRHWRITDATGHTETVDGDGVVGKQPEIRPGEGFEYTSGAPLPTPSGLMVGQFMMETDNGEAFAVEIPAFSLDSPHDMQLVH